MAPTIIIIGLLFSVFSTVILSYISIATMVGPWIAPTIVLLGHFLFILTRNSLKKTRNIIAIQAIGAGGGIIATGIGFGFPTLHFLDPHALPALLANPGQFCLFFAILCLAAGGFGLLLGSYLTKPLVDEQQQPFPVSSLTVQVATSDSSSQEARMLLGGIAGTTILCVLRDGIASCSAVLKKHYYLFSSWFGHEISLGVAPTLWAIGFSVGLSFTVPLVIGMVAKYLVVLPLSQHALYLPFRLFDPIDAETFSIAFCSGLVACELLLQGPGMLRKLLTSKKQTSRADLWAKGAGFCHAAYMTMRTSSVFTLGSLSAVTLGCIGLLTFYGFSIWAQILLLLFTAVATYSICSISGKIGMVPFGRFSTFIVVPLLLIFRLNPLQTTIVIVFFNICAAAASDLLFDMKSADLVGIDRKKMYHYQWVGLIGTAVCVGFILWLLFTNLQLGSEALFAQRGRAKALLLQSLNMDTTIVLIGVCFGWLLKRFKINSTMVFGGLVMPNGVTIGLAIGSLGTLLVKKQEKLQPLCAGILAAESLWIMGSILLGK